MVKTSEKGSITLFTLIAMMFFLTIAFTAYASAMSKLQGQNDDLERIKASYEQDLTPEGLAKLYNELTGTREWLPGDGTEQNPYKIYTIEDLLTLSNKTNAGNNYSGKYIELMNDLDFNDVRSYEKYDRTDFGDVNENGTVEGLRTELTTGEGWQAIGTESKSFMGSFDGNNNTLRNLFMNNNNNNQGLFGVCNNTTINDFCVTGKIISTGSRIGGIVGYGMNSMVFISNCDNYVKIDCDYNGGLNGYVGGIVGHCNGTIKNCTNHGNISSITRSSESRVGGIAGASVYMEKCMNFGEINGNSIDVAYSNIGGISGTVIGSGHIVNCHNEGKIIGMSVSSPLIGGIAGVNSANCLVQNCYNKGEVVSLKASSFAGGIVGDNYGDNAIVKKCYSIGKITVNNVEKGLVTGAHVYESKTEDSFGPTDYFGISNTPSKTTNCELKSREEMKTQAFVDLLNTNQTDAPWIMDTTGINNGYPILKWQLQN